MAQDKANIFKLSDKEQKEYIKDPFFDCMPGAEDFAKELHKDILTKETPHVVLLEANYGMGKTFFSTRFAQYLQNNKLETVYFSAWENDYLPDPFLSFSKELISYFNKKAESTAVTEDKPEIFVETKKIKTKAEKLIPILTKLAESLSISTPLVKIDVAKVIKAFKQDVDPLQKFKKDFAKFIDNLDGKKLVLIVDELDRCRPDYAMKVLEIIKHFFDIEGLFVIVPTNMQALETSLEALYGIKSAEFKKIHDCENYFNKFFNETNKIPDPDYTKLIKHHITPIKLDKAIKSGHIIEANGRFNSLNILITALSTYGKTAQLSLRQMTDICKKIIHICKHFKEEIRLEYLAYLICNEERKKKTDKDYDQPLQITIDEKHNFSGHQPKIKLLDLNIYKNNILQSQFPPTHIYSGYNNFKRVFLSEYQNKKCTFTSYLEMQQFIDEQKKNLAVNNFSINGSISSAITEHLENLNTILIEKEQEIKSFQQKYGSDDEDEKRSKKYRKIAEKNHIIHKEN